MLPIHIARSQADDIRQPDARVREGGKQRVIPSAEGVPGALNRPKEPAHFISRHVPGDRRSRHG
jgi:hypothetical protein